MATVEQGEPRFADGHALPCADDSFDALVEKVRQEALQEASYDQERIERFLEARETQQQLLEDARRRLARENARADRLRDQYESNELTLTQYESDLEERAGDLNDLFAIVRQTAAPETVMRCV